MNSKNESNPGIELYVYLVKFVIYFILMVISSVFLGEMINSYMSILDRLFSLSGVIVCIGHLLNFYKYYTECDGYYNARILLLCIALSLIYALRLI